MSEWLKILLSAIAGMMTGVLLEPLKYWVGKRLSAYEAKKLIYRELATAYYILDDTAKSEGLESASQQLITETFDYYFEKKRELIHLIPNHVAVAGVYGGIRAIRKLAEFDLAAAEVRRQKWIKQVDLFVLSGVLETSSFAAEMKKAETFIDEKSDRMLKLLKRVVRRIERRKRKEIPSIKPELN